MIEFPEFTARTQLEEFIVSLAGNDATTVLIRGSTAYGEIREFSDVDVEVWGVTPFRAIYRFAFFNSGLILITMLYMGSRDGETTKIPEGVNVLKGVYTRSMDGAAFNEGDREGYDTKAWVVRRRQVVVDEMFKYLRHRDAKTLAGIQEKLTF